MIRKIDRITCQLVVNEKYCSWCEETHSKDAFNSSANEPDGKQRWCRVGQREYNAQHSAAKRNSSEVTA